MSKTRISFPILMYTLWSDLFHTLICLVFQHKHQQFLGRSGRSCIRSCTLHCCCCIRRVSPGLGRAQPGTAPAIPTPCRLEQGTPTGCDRGGIHTCLETGSKRRRDKPFGTCGGSYSRSHAWGKTSSSQGWYCAAEGARLPLRKGPTAHFQLSAGSGRHRPRCPCSAEGARGRRGSHRHLPPPRSPPRCPSGGTQGGEGGAESADRAVPGRGPRAAGRAPAERRGRASPGPSPPRQPSAGRCRSGSGKPRPPPRVWRGWAHPRHCLRGAPCLLRAPAGGVAVVAAMLKGCAPPQTRQQAQALGSSHPAC